MRDKAPFLLSLCPSLSLPLSLSHPSSTPSISFGASLRPLSILRNPERSLFPSPPFTAPPFCFLLCCISGNRPHLDGEYLLEEGQKESHQRAASSQMEGLKLETRVQATHSTRLHYLLAHSEELDGAWKRGRGHRQWALRSGVRSDCIVQWRGV